MSEARICFVFPSRSRPARFFNTLDNIRVFTQEKNHFILAKLDLDDVTMNTPQVILRIQNDYPEVIVKWGYSGSKISAVNRSMEDLPPCDILILQSDDICWDEWGFDTEIRNAFKKHFPDFLGTLHYPDDHGRAETIIVSILGIKLYRMLGYVYHPRFFSVFADNHFTEMTKAIKKHVFIRKRLFSHLHPIWGAVPWDQQYRDSEAPDVYKKDRETFFDLKNNNYGL